MNIQDIQEKYKLSKEPNVDFWHHQQSGKWILTHDACEKIAHQEGIVQINIETLNSEKDFARFLITMAKGDVTITEIGEADDKNCYSGYKGCMAHKRGIDRCVLKLIHAYEYGIASEVEAEDFKKPNYYQKRESHLEQFDNLIQDSYFDGKRKDVKDKWKEIKTLSETETFLRQMKLRIDENQKEPVVEELV